MFATALRRRLRGAADRRRLAKDLAATSARLVGRGTSRLGTDVTGDDLFDPYTNPGTDILVDESYHGIDHGLGIAHPDTFEPPSVPDGPFGL